MELKYRTLCIGVSQYDNASISTLPPCDREALDVYKTLTSPRQGLCTTAGSMVLTSRGLEGSGTSNRSSIMAHLDRLCEMSNEEEGLIVYFSGHGTERGDENYIIPRDTEPTLISETTVALKTLYQKLRGAKASHKVLILDCCKPGFLIGKDVGFNESLEQEIEKLQKSMDDHRLAVIASCSARQVSHVLEDGSYSVFTYYLLEGLNGGLHADGGYITLGALYKYVKEAVREWSMQNDKQQVPLISFEGTLDTDILIAREVPHPSAEPIEEVGQPIAAAQRRYGVTAVSFDGAEQFYYPTKLEDAPLGGHPLTYYSSDVNFFNRKITTVDQSAVPEYQKKAEDAKERTLAEITAKLVTNFDAGTFKRDYNTKVQFDYGSVYTGTAFFHNRAECTYSVTIKQCPGFIQILEEFEQQLSASAVSIRCMGVASDLSRLLEHVKSHEWPIKSYMPGAYFEFHFQPLGKESRPALIKISIEEGDTTIIFKKESMAKEYGIKDLLASLNTLLPLDQ